MRQHGVQCGLRTKSIILPYEPPEHALNVVYDRSVNAAMSFEHLRNARLIVGIKSIIDWLRRDR